MMMLQHIWQGLCEGLLMAAVLFLNPFSALLLLLSVVVIAFSLRGSKDRLGKVALCLATILSGYTMFNVADYCVYRYCGAVAVSPVNQIFFQLFCSPEDLYEPYASIVLSPEKTEYEVDFLHKYAGREEIAFCISGGERWIEKYDECLNFVVTSKGSLTSEDGATMEIDDVSDVKVFAPCKISITIHHYCLDNRFDCRKKYKLKIKFGGNYSEMVKYYAGVRLVAGNATTK